MEVAMRTRIRSPTLVVFVLAALLHVTVGFTSSSEAHPHHRLQASINNNNGESIDKFRVASSRGSEAVRARPPNDGSSGWNALKRAIYGTADGVGSLTEKLASKGGESRVEGGYASIEREVYGGNYDDLSPGQRLMQQYRARSQAQVTAPPPPATSPSSAFDAFKETLYGSLDVASRVFSPSPREDTPQSESLRSSFKPLVQSTLASSQVQNALPDLRSSNPIKRRLAEAKIQNYEAKARKRQRALEREEAARKFKESVYQLGDAVVASAESLAAVPAVLSKAADETQVIAKKVKRTVDKIPVQVDQAVTTVVSIPDQVQQKTNQVQDSVKTTLKTTQQVIQEVGRLPTKIETSVRETRQKVDAARTAVDEAATAIKVLVGLEKPKPKPPKVPPPPPIPLSELGWKLAGSVVTGVATGTARLAWWAGKGAAVAAWNGVQSAFRNPNNNNGPTASLESSSAQVDPEVQIALDLARSALEFADQEAPLKRPNNNGNGGK